MHSGAFNVVSRRASLMALVTTGLTALSHRGTAEARKNSKNRRKQVNANALCKKQVGQCRNAFTLLCAGDAECLATFERCCPTLGICDFDGFFVCVEATETETETEMTARLSVRGMAGLTALAHPGISSAKKRTNDKKARKRCTSQIGQCQTRVNDLNPGCADDPVCQQLLTCCDIAGRCQFAEFIECVAALAITAVPNAFGCLDVGQPCSGQSAACCSGICQGKEPLPGQNDRSRCVAHNTGGCLAAEQSCGFDIPDVPCGVEGFCLLTTGNAGFCGDAAGGACAACRRDEDCQAGFGAGAACVVCSNGRCPETGDRACVPAAA